MLHLVLDTTRTACTSGEYLFVLFMTPSSHELEPPTIPGWFIALLITVACGGGEQWNGVVYSDGSNLLDHRELGVFVSLEDCREAALSYLESIGALEDGDYECGRDCESKGHGVMVCEETRR